MCNFTMCDNLQCSVKEECFRYTATPDSYGQPYFYNVEKNVEGRECENFIDNSFWYNGGGIVVDCQANHSIHM